MTISGLGFVVYSPFATSHILPGEDYLTASFLEPEDVLRHVLSCRIATFGTGTPGDFILRVFDGKLNEEAMRSADFKLRLCLEVRDEAVHVRDVNDLMEWDADCPKDQVIGVPDGFYRITAYSNRPGSGILGQDQEIFLHFEKTPAAPAIRYDDIPMLGPEE
jgi:hypothetical protein